MSASSDDTILSREWIIVKVMDVTETAIKTNTVISIAYDQWKAHWAVVTSNGVKYHFKNDSCSGSDWCWAIYKQAARKPAAASADDEID